MTLRKLTLAAVATVALTSSAFAADQAAQSSNWGLGFGMYNAGNTQSAAVVTYLNNQFIVQGALGYETDKLESSNTHAVNTGLSFGLRNMMNNQVSLDYGVDGSYGFVSNKDSDEKDPYMLGVFVGVDFQPVQNILLTAAIQPYTYIREAGEYQDKVSRVLSAGSISLSYLF